MLLFVLSSHFWSVRVSRDIRLIVHKTDASLLGLPGAIGGKCTVRES